MRVINVYSSDRSLSQGCQDRNRFSYSKNSQSTAISETSASMSRDLVPETRNLRMGIMESEIVVLVFEDGSACKSGAALESTKDTEGFPRDRGRKEIDAMTFGTLP